MVGVEQWAEIRRMQHVERRLEARDRPPHRAAPRHDPPRARRAEPPSYGRAAARLEARPVQGRRSSELLRRRPTHPVAADPRDGSPSSAMRAARRSSTIYVRELRPAVPAAARTYQRTVYRPGELVQFDLWEPKAEIPVGHGQTRRGYVVTCELGYSRAVAGALVFSKEAPDIALGHEPLPGAARRAAREAGLGSRGRDPRRRRPPDRRLRRLLRRSSASAG